VRIVTISSDCRHILIILACDKSPDDARIFSPTIVEEACMKRGSTRRLGRRSFLKGALATAPLLTTDEHLVEGGQLLAMFIDPDIASPFGDKHGHRHENDDDEDEN
jgi:hypothetical protein